MNSGAPGISAVLRRKLTPKVSKFLPSGYMPISRADLALVMRLNAEVVDIPHENLQGGHREVLHPEEVIKIVQSAL